MLILSVGLGIMGLSACSSTESAPPTPIPNTRANVAQLAGTWNTNFTIERAFSDRIQLSQISVDDQDPNDFYIWGANKAGLLAIGWYEPANSTYVITVGTDEVTQFYEFTSIASDGRVSGNTWFSSESSYSDDYTFTGQRTLETASVRAQRPRAEVQQLFQKLKASRH